MPPPTLPVRDRLLEAIPAVLGDVGLAGLSLREVARRANVSHAAPAHHFANKAGMLTAFAAQGFARLTDEMARELEGVSEPRAALAAVGRAYVRFAVANPTQFELMFRQELLLPEHPSYVAASDAAWGTLVDVLTRARDAGLVRAPDLETTAVATWSLAHGLAGLAISGRLARRVPVDANAVAANVCARFAECVLHG